MGVGYELQPRLRRIDTSLSWRAVGMLPRHAQITPFGPYGCLTEFPPFQLLVALPQRVINGWVAQ